MSVKVSKVSKMPDATPAVGYTKWDKAVLIPTKELVFCDWNCNEMSQDKLAELVADVENIENPEDPHFDEPLQAVPIKTKGKSKGRRWLVLGGFHRAKAMTILNQDEVPCVIRWDLKDKSREELMAWTVRRNHLRGKVNASKYAEIEDAIITQGGLTKEAARHTMMMDNNLANALRASLEKEKQDTSAAAGSGDSEGGFDSDGEREATETRRDRASLLKALQIAEQDVLLDSADTVEHGYLFFAQGSKGQMHLVVNESKRLFGLVKQMVAACKGNSAKVDDFVSAALQQELQNWE